MAAIQTTLQYVAYLFVSDPRQLFMSFPRLVGGRIRAELAWAGRAIGTLDIQIAAMALACGLIPVTDNVNGFRRVPGLPIQVASAGVPWPSCCRVS